MEIGKTLCVSAPEDWRAWLAENYKGEREIWLVYYRKHTGKERIPYNQAVEEALCFGWIDSIVKKLDDERTVQRFTPRNPKSVYSQTNKERLRKLLRQGKVLPEIRAALGNILEEPFIYPEDIMTALLANTRAWENFQSYSESYKRIRIAYIEAARERAGEFEKRLANFLKKTAQDKQFGFGIEEYY